MCSHINVGTGTDLTIKEVAETIKSVTGFEGKIEFDSSKPDGAPRKLIDSMRLNMLGWQAEVELENGLKTSYKDYQSAGKLVV